MNSLSGTKAGQVQLTFYNIAPPPKVGRLNSEIVIKTAFMGLPVLASRSGFTAWGVRDRATSGADVNRANARTTVYLSKWLRKVELGCRHR